jgi:hypothetical protein
MVLNLIILKGIERKPGRSCKKNIEPLFVRNKTNINNTRIGDKINKRKKATKKSSEGFIN